MFCFCQPPHYFLEPNNSFVISYKSTCCFFIFYIEFHKTTLYNNPIREKEVTPWNIIIPC